MTSHALVSPLLVILTLFVVYRPALTVSGRRFDTSQQQELRSYFRCPPCDREQCQPVPAECPETAMELGVCACCPVCALSQGSKCGVYSKPCGKNLKCLPDKVKHDTADDGVRSLFYGEGRCSPVESVQQQPSIKEARFRPSWKF